MQGIRGYFGTMRGTPASSVVSEPRILVRNADFYFGKIDVQAYVAPQLPPASPLADGELPYMVFDEGDFEWLRKCQQEDSRYERVLELLENPEKAEGEKEKSVLTKYLMIEGILYFRRVSRRKERKVLCIPEAIVQLY